MDLRSSREIRHSKSTNLEEGRILTIHHVHQLKKKKASFLGDVGDWICDGCGTYNDPNRYQCIKKCDYDLCASCVQRDLLPETKLSSLHTHPLRSYEFPATTHVSCDMCERNRLGGTWWNCAYGCNFDLCTDCFEGKGQQKENYSHFSHFIPTQEVFDKLCYSPSEHTFTNTKIIKVVYSVLRDKIHFINTQNYKYHYAFVTGCLQENWDLGKFNKKCYEDDDRPFILGSLTHFIDQGKYTFDIWPGDTLKSGPLNSLFNLIQKSVFFSSSLYFRPLSDFHTSQLQYISIPSISSLELHKGVQFQPLTLGKSYGYLRFFLGPCAKYDLNKIEPTDIVICEETPIGMIPNLPAVTGLVTSQLQTPLCHVALLCQNRVTPNMALQGAHQMNNLLSLEGKCVMMSVSRDKWEIKEVDQNRANTWFQALLTPKKRLEVKFKIKQQGCSALIKGLDTPNVDIHQTSQHLIDKITKGTIDSGIMKTFISKIEDWGNKGIFNHASGIIFRSSTNVEDLPGFNGAGLYSSISVKTNDFSSDNFVHTIKEVYQSVWTKRAIVERKLFGIVEEHVHVAILVQPFYSGDKVLANGVGITRNPFRNDFPAHFLNVQISGHSVTDGTGIPEQILVYDEGKPICEIISRSSLNNGLPLLKESDIEKLWVVMKDLHSKRNKKKKNSSNCVDIEFLVLNTESRDIVLLQCRPLKLTK